MKHTFFKSLLLDTNTKDFFCFIEQSGDIIKDNGDEIENDTDRIVTKYTENNSKSKSNKGNPLSDMSLFPHSGRYFPVFYIFGFLDIEIEDEIDDRGKQDITSINDCCYFEVWI